MVAAQVLLMVACTVPGTQPPPVELTVFGAASLGAVLAEAKVAYESAVPGTKLILSTDSSSALRTQIEQGAPADLFLSADTANPQVLVDSGLADGQAVPFAGNLLTIIVPTDGPTRVAAPVDLAADGVEIVAAGDAVPITGYAVRAVENMGRLRGYPAHFAARYASNIVSHEDDVKAIVAKIGLGEGDAGIVYVTDARGSSSVATVPIPAEANVPAAYAGVVVRASPHHQAARAFLDWLRGPDGQAILTGSGFLPAPS